MDNNIYFSIVIPLYNKEKYISKTLLSVLNQTFKEFEIIVVDDGSTDNSCNIVESINDSRIKLIKQKNAGPSKARNTGIKNAVGKYIAFLDADDEWENTKLEEHFKLHTNNTDVFWSGSGYTAKSVDYIENINYNLPSINKDGLNLLINNYKVFFTSTIVIRLDVFLDENFLFNEKVKRSEDREVWIKMCCKYPKFGYISKKLAIYNIGLEESLSSTGLIEKDFSFLELPKRLETFLESLKSEKKDMLIKYFSKYNLNKILTIWGWTNSYNDTKQYFEEYISVEIIKKLNRLYFLPKVIRKIIVKIIQRLNK